MSVIDDFLGTVNSSVKSVADAYVQINAIKNANGLAKSQNTINELMASTSALRTQTEYAQAQAELERARKGDKSMFDLSNLSSNKAVQFALVAGGLLLVYKWLK